MKSPPATGKVHTKRFEKLTTGSLSDPKFGTIPINKRFSQFLSLKTDAIGKHNVSPSMLRIDMPMDWQKFSACPVDQQTTE